MVGKSRPAADEPVVSSQTADIGLAKFYLFGQILCLSTCLFVVPGRDIPADPEKVPFHGEWLFVLLPHLYLVVRMHSDTLNRRAVALKILSFLLFFLHIGIYSAIMYRSLGPQHFEGASTPGPLDWTWYICVHAVHATDLLDVLHEYGVELPTLSPASLDSQLVLFVVYVATGLFLGRVLVACMKGAGLRSGLPKFQVLAVIAVLAAIAAYFGTAATEGWAHNDWVAWPIENMLKTVDVVDAMQFWGWKLHEVEPSVWHQTLAVLFRVAVGSVLAALFVSIRLRFLGGAGFTGQELVDHVRGGQDATHALSRLKERLDAKGWSFQSRARLLRDAEDIAGFLGHPEVDTALQPQLEALRQNFVRALIKVSTGPWQGSAADMAQVVGALSVLGDEGFVILAEELSSRNTRPWGAAEALPLPDQERRILEAISAKNATREAAASALRTVLRNRAQPREKRKAAAGVLAHIAPDEHRRVFKK